MNKKNEYKKIILESSPDTPPLFQVEEINIGISLKAHAYSHMMHMKLHSKGTHCLNTFTKSEVRK